MATTDLQLLSLYHQRGDGMAFRELVQAHATMVFATAQRVTRDVSMAEDVAQETFVQLARHSRTISESVAAWLHRVAWRRACNAVRDEVTRRRYEEAASTEVASTCEASWTDLERVLDEVLDELPDEQRAPLVLHFLEGRSQRDIARELSVSQSTVSRAMEAALEEVRAKMRMRGVLCGSGLAAVLLSGAQQSMAAPASLIATASKLGLTGMGSMTTAAAAAGGGLGLVAKLGLALVVITLVGASAVKVASARTQAAPTLASQQAVPPSSLGQAGPSTQVAQQGNPIRSAIPQRLGRAQAVVAAPQAKLAANLMPVHELVHSFSRPPEHPVCRMLLHEGWLWATIPNGGEYGCGILYKMRPDGSDWQALVSFHDDGSSLSGMQPRHGLIAAGDGLLWGSTMFQSGKTGGTIFSFDPTTNQLTTVLTHPTAVHLSWSDGTPEGALWGHTGQALCRYDRKAGKLEVFKAFTGKQGALPGRMVGGHLVPDGKGFLWGITETGGAANAGTVFKVKIASGECSSVVQFTDKAGAFPGKTPRGSLVLFGEHLWGCTSLGGRLGMGTLFRIHRGSGVLTMMAEFLPGQDGTGTQPDSALLADGQGRLWGTASYGGRYGSGTVFKFDLATAKLVPVVQFTGRDGAAPGGPARGDLIADGRGGLVAASGFGGRGHAGTLYRIDVATGQYKLLLDVSDLSSNLDGTEPWGALGIGQDGWLWGTARHGGAQQQGTVYKVNAATNEFRTVVSFSGTSGTAPGSIPSAGLTSDRRGFMWGTTMSGGRGDKGVVFKVEEKTGAYTLVAESCTALPMPSSVQEMTLDAHGFMWGCTGYSVYKVDVRSHKLTVVAGFGGDRSPPYGSHPSTLTLDPQGHLWGCAFASYGQHRSSVFRINTADDRVTVVREFTSDSPRSSGWFPEGQMSFDPQGALWFAGPDQSGAQGCALFRLQPQTSQITWTRDMARHRFTSPASDSDGLLWGTRLSGGNGHIYRYDPASRRFTDVLAFSGYGSGANVGDQVQSGRLVRHDDGNFYAVTRYGGPGGGGTIYRLRFGPTPLTQQAIVKEDGRVELIGVVTTNGLDAQTSFEWGEEASLSNPSQTPTQWVPAEAGRKTVSAELLGLKAGQNYYFRLTANHGPGKKTQRGGMLSFVIADGSDLAGGGKTTAGEGDDHSPGVSANSARTFALQVHRVPGAGAGLVTGALQGEAYSLGMRGTLVAVADNGYVFDHWSGPGITGARAERAKLDFIVDEALARNPNLTATFVRNPFTRGHTGSFQGLVLNAEGSAPSLANTGALRLQVIRSGRFTGKLLINGAAEAIAGQFDHGGLARFGVERMPMLTIMRRDEQALMLMLRLDLSDSASSEITGSVGFTPEAAPGSGKSLPSSLRAVRGHYDARENPVPRALLEHEGRYSFTLTSEGEDDSTGTLNLSLAGNTVLAVKLSDGSGVIASAPLSHQHEALFFTPLYRAHQGSFAGGVILDDWLPKNELVGQPFWWCRPQMPWLDLLATPAGE